MVLAVLVVLAETKAEHGNGKAKPDISEKTYVPGPCDELWPEERPVTRRRKMCNEFDGMEWKKKRINRKEKRTKRARGILLVLFGFFFSFANSF